MVERAKDLTDEIRASFEAGRLDYLVGAGTSVDAGLPNWSTLNNRLLRAFFTNQLSDRQGELQADLRPEPDELNALAELLSERLGRYSVVDLVKNRVEPEKFTEMLKIAMYGRIGDAELKPVQHELAAAISERPPERILTTNIDNLLERAYGRLHGIEDVHGADEIGVVCRPGAIDATTREFVHLHGYLPPRRPPREPLVLSEQDYWRTSGNWATGLLKTTLLADDKDLLVVGKDFADPRLREVLLDRVERGGESGRVYVVLETNTGARKTPLAERRAHHLMSRYQRKYWAELGAEVQFVRNLELLPTFLRRIRLGTDPRDWWRGARAFLRQRAEEGECLYDRLHHPDVQRRARDYLEIQLRFIRRKFEAPSEEELTFGFFVPSPDASEEEAARIRLAFRFSDRFQGARYEIASGEGDPFQGVPEAHGEERELEVDSVDEAQGAAGYAYVTGTVCEARHGSSALNRNFDPTMQDDWDGGRTFSSLLSVPIYGSERWLPLGVGFLSSNRRDPFWSDRTARESILLHRLIRASFRELLDYDES